MGFPRQEIFYYRLNNLDIALLKGVLRWCRQIRLYHPVCTQPCSLLTSLLDLIVYLEFTVKTLEDFNLIEKQLEELKLDPSQLEQEAQADIIETLTFYNDTIDRLEQARLRVTEEHKKIEGLALDVLEQKIGTIKSQKHALELHLARTWQLPEPVRTKSLIVIPLK